MFHAGHGADFGQAQSAVESSLPGHLASDHTQTVCIEIHPSG